MNPRDPRWGWIQRYADGLATAEEAARLEQSLREDPQLRGAFLEYLNLDSALESLAAAQEAATAEKLVPFPRWPRLWLAAAMLLALIGGWVLWNGMAGKVSATVVAARDASGWRVGDAVALRKVSLPGGELQLRLSSGALVTISGPAKLEFLNAMRIRVQLGKVTADVGDKAKGFAVETAQTQVVDLGTKFGVDVEAAGHTDVVVFQGEVELFDRNQRRPQETPKAHLVEGEAVRVDGRQQFSRIANVTSGPRDEEWSTRGVPDASAVITSVRDNLRDPEARNYYRILPGGLQEDTRAFVGQRHEWNGLDARGLPPQLLGADLVQTFSSDRYKTALEITVTVSRPAVLYVFFDDRHTHPVWLTEGFKNTGAKIGLENVPDAPTRLPANKGPGVGHMAACSVWARELPAGGSVTLGSPRQAGDETGEQKPYWNWMYGIAAKPLESK